MTLRHNERRVEEVGGAHGLARDQRIVVAQEDAPGVGGGEAQVGVAVHVGVAHEHGEVVDAVLQALDEVRGVAAVQVEAHARVLLAKGAHVAGDHAQALRLAGADEDVALHDVLAVHEVRCGLVREAHDFLRTSPQVEALLGGRDAAAVALEERAAELAFQRGDLPGERGLRHVQCLRGARHGAVLADGEKVAKRAEFHGHSITSRNNTICDISNCSAPPRDGECDKGTVLCLMGGGREG